MRNRSDNGNIYITIIIPPQCHTQSSHHWDDNNNMSLALKYTIRYRALFIFRLLNDARNRNNREMRAEFYDHTGHVSCTESDDGEGEHYSSDVFSSDATAAQ